MFDLREKKKTPALQHILDEVVLSGMVYGPLTSRYDSARHCLVGGGNWMPGVREPYPARIEEWGDDPANWPPAAACSTLAGLVVGAYLGHLMYSYRSHWGRSMTRALKNELPLSNYALWAANGRRVYSWLDIARGRQIVTPLTVVLYRGHVSLVVDADAEDLHHPRTGEKLEGRWVLSADGNFRDTERYRLGRRLVRRLYCGRPITFESANVRAARDKQSVALVGISPSPWPSSQKPLVIENPRGRQAEATKPAE